MDIVYLECVTKPRICSILNTEWVLELSTTSPYCQYGIDLKRFLGINTHLTQYEYRVHKNDTTRSDILQGQA